jgi:hypothetical protein
MAWKVPQSQRPQGSSPRQGHPTQSTAATNAATVRGSVPAYAEKYPYDGIQQMQVDRIIVVFREGDHRQKQDRDSVSMTTTNTNGQQTCAR